MFDRIQSFIQSDQSRESLSMIEMNRETLYLENPAQTVTLELTLLIDSGDYEKATARLEDYQNRAYISQEIEDLLRSFKGKLTRQHTPSRNFDLAHVFRLIQSDEETKVIAGFQRIKYHLEELEVLKPAIAKALTRQYSHNIFYELAPALFLIFPQQTVTICYFGETKAVTLDETSMTKTHRDNYQVIHQALVHLTNNVTHQELATNLLEQFTIEIYPFRILSEEAQPLAHLFLYMTKLALDENKQDAKDALLAKVSPQIVELLMNKYHLAMFLG